MTQYKSRWDDKICGAWAVVMPYILIANWKWECYNQIDKCGLLGVNVRYDYTI